MPKIDGKVALITGASAGIGAATAVHLASMGCYVAINGRNMENLTRTFNECVEAGLPNDKVLMVQGDVGNEETCKKIVERTVEHFGQLDILINNAGFGQILPLENTTFADFDSILSTNLKGVFAMIKWSVPFLKLTKGNVINVSSALGQVPTSHVYAYAASKAGLDQMTKCIALELGPSQIRVNCISPGYIYTEIFAKTGLNPEQEKALFDKVKREHALERMGDPIEIAKPIGFLCSPDASFITGTVILVDGGYALKN